MTTRALGLRAALIINQEAYKLPSKSPYCNTNEMTGCYGDFNRKWQLLYARELCLLLYPILPT
jgi:hypothetical protein